jgi:glycosyltransferase involved in cell wall biosynthesis
MQRARAFVSAAEEDFGIAAVEAQACGTPVIAYGRGGLAETVVEGQTGLFFAEQTPGSLIEAMATFETLRARFDSDLIRRNAERFSRQRFQQEFSAFVEREYAAFLANGGVASSARQRIPQTNQSLKVAGSLPDGCPAEFERG